MKILIVLCILYCGIGNTLLGQEVDYRTMRKQLSTLSCGKVDSVSVYETKLKLESMDTTKIVKDLDYYYRDLAWCFYRNFMLHYDTTYLKLDILNYTKSLYHKPQNTQALWGVLFGYYKLGDCLNGKKYLDLYLKYADAKEVNNEQIARLRKNCE